MQPLYLYIHIFLTLLILPQGPRGFTALRIMEIPSSHSTTYVKLTLLVLPQGLWGLQCILWRYRATIILMCRYVYCVHTYAHFTRFYYRVRGDELCCTLWGYRATIILMCTCAYTHTYCILLQGPQDLAAVHTLQVPCSHYIGVYLCIHTYSHFTHFTTGSAGTSCAAHSGGTVQPFGDSS